MIGAAALVLGLALTAGSRSLYDIPAGAADPGALRLRPDGGAGGGRLHRPAARRHHVRAPRLRRAQHGADRAVVPAPRAHARPAGAPAHRWWSWPRCSWRLLVFDFSASLVLIRRRYPGVRLRLRDFEWATVRRIFSFSMYVLLLAAGARLSFETDALVIGAVLGVARDPVLCGRQQPGRLPDGFHHRDCRGRRADGDEAGDRRAARRAERPCSSSGRRSRCR